MKSSTTIKVTFNVTPSWHAHHDIPRTGRALAALCAVASVAEAHVTRTEFIAVVYAPDDVTSGSLKELDAKLTAIVEAVV